MRRFTPQVEEYSIDEAFADITGMRRALRASYETIALKHESRDCQRVSITVSVGLSLTKVLAKVASKHQKPDGFTPIPGRMIAKYLEHLPVEKIWGIGHATTNYLNKMGVRTAWSLPGSRKTPSGSVSPSPVWKSGENSGGESVYPVHPEERAPMPPSAKPRPFHHQAITQITVCPSDEESGNRPVSRPGVIIWRQNGLWPFLKRNDFSYTGRESG